MRTIARHLQLPARAAGALFACAAMATVSMPPDAVGADAATKAPPAAIAGDASPRVARRQVSPIVAEMLQVLEQRDRSLAEVQARLKQAPDERAALVLQREAERIKSDAEISLLRVQAGHARREGRLKTAAELEAAIEIMLRPLPPKAAVQRVPRAAQPR